MKHFFLTILCSISLFLSAEELEHLDFAFVIASYNNGPWIEDNLNSIRMQIVPKNANYEVYYINDASTDNTKQKVNTYINKYALGENWFVFHNPKRMKALANFYNIITSLDPKKIVIIVDGDDKLDNPYVLETLAQVYRTPVNGKRIWLTYGSYRTSSDPKRLGHRGPFPPQVIKQNQFRWSHFYCSHLRTFYAGLFQKIKKDHLMWKDQFVPICTDVATMIPMIEMSANGHFYFINKILYVYNNHNPVSKKNKDKKLRPKISNLIRSYKAYKPLTNLWED